MRATAILALLVLAASASAEPRIEGKVSQEDVRGITAAIRATTQDRIVVIRKSSQPYSAGVQTASGPTAGCQYFVRRIAGTWKIMGKSCWTHVMTPQTAPERWTPLTRPAQLSEADFTAIRAAIAKHTHDEIRTIKVTQNSPLTVHVHTASSHIVTEGDYTARKIGGDWKLWFQISHEIPPSTRSDALSRQPSLILFSLDLAVDRYTSMGISNDAREFLDAAHLVRREKPVWFAPTYFLACQSIELSLKAFLRGSGYSDKQLRQLGHDLDACIAAARAAGLESHASLSEADVEAVGVINAYYHSKDLQYSMSGYKSYPPPESLLALAERLWESLRTFCIEHRDYHVGKATSVA